MKGRYGRGEWASHGARSVYLTSSLFLSAAAFTLPLSLLLPLMCLSPPTTVLLCKSGSRHRSACPVPSPPLMSFQAAKQRPDVQIAAGFGSGFFFTSSLQERFRLFSELIKRNKSGPLTNGFILQKTTEACRSVLLPLRCRCRFHW